jgi:hypothetical protein
MSMTRIEKMPARIGFAILAAALLSAVTPGEAAARHVKHIAHHHVHQQVQTAQADTSQPSNLGPMRYYGGPKSPMWRETGVQTASVQTTSSNTGGMRYYGGPKSPMWRQ